MRFAYAGGRDIGVWVLDFLIGAGYSPEAVLVSAPPVATHSDQIVERCPGIAPELVFRGDEFRTAAAMETLGALGLDLLVCVHFPYLVPAELLAVPSMGAVNLHPAFLPYNRGWHTPTWALLEERPIGATLHFMTPEVDAGDVIHQKRLVPDPGDTAHTLYEKLKRLELEVFTEAWPLLRTGTYTRRAQRPDEGTMHRRRDLFRPEVQEIDLDATVRVGDLLRRLRALTTNRLDEAAYYTIGDRRYRVQVTVTEEPIE